jgi:hypothetical protein
MSDPVLVFVNERPLAVAPGTRAGEAAQRADGGGGALGEALATGQAFLTDGRGIRLDPATPLTAGAIVRVVRSARGADRPPSDSAPESEGARPR